ncbi:MAG: DUF1439 domain-containing protein [Alteromonadaceae bacterium]|nr:DUF1439 domain-containing protein [Alteromonadaceae bacterium]
MWLLRFTLLALLCLTSSCSVISNMVSYSVTAEDIRALLQTKIDQLQTRTSVMGVQVDLSVSHIEVDIAPNNKQVVTLSVDGKATAKAFGMQYPVDVSLGLEGEPYYESKEKAIYIRSLSLTHSVIDAAGLKINMTLLANEYMDVFNDYLATHAVYQISNSDPGAFWLSHRPFNMVIKPGVIVFTPQAQP